MHCVTNWVVIIAFRVFINTAIMKIRIAAVDGWFNVIRQVTATCPPMTTHWRRLANTIELVHPSAHSSP